MTETTYTSAALFVGKDELVQATSSHICVLRPGQEGRDGKEGREKRKFCTDLDSCCSVSFGRAISQVAVKNNVHPHMRRGKPIVTRARLGHTFGQSRK